MVQCAPRPRPPARPPVVLHLLDIVGTFAFALSGAFRAVRHELDLLGVAALAVATGVGGGLVRDVLLGLTPPLVLVDQRYALVCVAGALVTFCAAPRIARRWDLVLAADAVGLAVFTAIGAARAESVDAVPLTVVLMATLTACGGGVIRDLLVNEVPAVLTHDFYASAALLGGTVFVALGGVAVDEDLRIAVTIAVTLAARVLAMRLRFGLPRVRALPQSPSQLTRARKTRHDDQ
ncbi:MAG: trimeric intracellular cation channel family protein [Gammaproteobacteria bacterium]|nr:trimeric intracellular cation channel family protein [Gammaproteobacteria bacterium]